MNDSQTRYPYHYSRLHSSLSGLRRQQVHHGPCKGHALRGRASVSISNSISVIMQGRELAPLGMELAPALSGMALNHSALAPRCRNDLRQSVMPRESPKFDLALHNSSLDMPQTDTFWLLSNRQVSPQTSHKRKTRPILHLSPGSRSAPAYCAATRL